MSGHCKVGYAMNIVGTILGPTGRWKLRREAGGQWEMFVEVTWDYTGVRGDVWASESEIRFYEEYTYGP